jgi:hypothetical protein
MSAYLRIAYKKIRLKAKTKSVFFIVLKVYRVKKVFDYYNIKPNPC